MTWWGWLMFGTVALWLLPGSLWRPVALALLVQWAVAEGYYQATHDRFPRLIYIAGDIAVIAAVVFARRHWLDWLAILPYPAVWYLYAQDDTRANWIALYWIALGQFAIAGPWSQARSEMTIAGEFLQDLAGFIRSRLSRDALGKSQG